MTTFKYELSLNELEMMVVKDAFNRYIAICQASEPANRGSIYRIATLKDVMDRLLAGAVQTSGNNFFTRDPKPSP